jgi:hypothetical protein
MGTGARPIQRRSERIHVRMPVTLRVDSDPENVKHTVSTFDLSSHGARIFTTACLVSGQGVALILDEGSGISISGRVVWAGPIRSHLEGQAGIEFLSTLPVSS